jgi:hypothetical protein
MQTFIDTPKPRPAPASALDACAYSADEIYPIRSVLLPAETAKIIEYAKAVNHDDDGGHHISKSKTTLLPWVSELLWPTVLHVWPGARYPYGVDQMMKIYRLEAGRGAVAPHVDEDFEGPDGSVARYSILLYLNDDYTGGETIFTTKSGDLIAPHPTVGGGIIFRHDILHQGQKVLTGTKYVLKTDLFLYDI